MKIIFALIATLSLFSCRYDRFDKPSEPSAAGFLPNANISILHSLYTGRLVKVESDVVLGGWVVANDRDNNFHRSFVIQDKTGAVEIMVAMYDLHNIYPIGQYVLVRAKGMTVGSSYGIMQLGLGAYSSGSTSPEYIHYPSILSRYVKQDNTTEIQEPLTCTASMLSDNLCGQLLTVQGLSLGDDEPSTWVDQDGYGYYNYRKFNDVMGGQVAVVVSSYARFANSNIPLGMVSVTGILQYGAANGKNMFILKLRNENDVIKM